IFTSTGLRSLHHGISTETSTGKRKIYWLVTRMMRIPIRIQAKFCRLSLDKNEPPEFLRRAGAEDRETVKW
ncbi:hypothetical protein LINPERPRIM_LOCUS6469, partial [Linum perenne]